MGVIVNESIDTELNSIIEDYFRLPSGRALVKIPTIHLWGWHGNPGPLADESAPTMPRDLDWDILAAIDFAHPQSCERSESAYVRECKKFLMETKQDKLQKLIRWRDSAEWQAKAYSWYAFNDVHNPFYPPADPALRENRTIASYWAQMFIPMKRERKRQ